MLLSSNIKSSAATLNEIINDSNNTIVVITVNESGTNGYVYSLYEQSDTLTYHNDNGNEYLTRTNGGNMTFWRIFGSDFNPLNDPDRNLSGFSQPPPFTILYDTIIQRGTVVNLPNNGRFFNSIDDYEHRNDLPPEPDTWYEILWNQFTDWIDSIGDSLSDGYEDFINWINGESTHGGGHSFELPDMVSPSPVPAPIPYNTVIIPKTDPDTGDTYYEFNYVYNNQSGTPIITGQPPDITVNDNDFEYPYYDNPDNKNNPYYFEMPWYLKFINGNNVFDLDDMGDNLTVIENAVNDETISDGVDTAYSSMGVLPSSWVQLIGIIAAIPLIGALIARFLKG